VALAEELHDSSNEDGKRKVSRQKATPKETGRGRTPIYMLEQEKGGKRDGPRPAKAVLFFEERKKGGESRNARVLKEGAAVSVRKKREKSTYDEGGNKSSS